MKKKICVISGSRADYSSCYPLLKVIKDDGTFTLQVVVTGMHLSPEFGLTYREIIKDGFVIRKKVKTLLFGDDSAGITKAIGLGIMRFADAFAQLKPDIVVVIGDRYETFAAVVAAFVAKIPIAHIGGGDVTRGVIDEAFRHAITKMSVLHFVSSNVHKRRIIQLGEDSQRVFHVGATHIDNVKKLTLLSRKELEKRLGFLFGPKNILVTYHPVTLEINTAGVQFKELLNALNRFPEIKIIFTKPNADADGKVIIRYIDEYVKRHREKAVAFISLGQVKYLSLLRTVDMIVGNSSSGIVEAPLFGTPAVNIGDRQEGRVRNGNVIDCKPSASSIAHAIQMAYDQGFRKRCKKIISPYGEGNASGKILRILKKEIHNINDLKKTFYDYTITCLAKALK